jgi:hypothetical protein
MNYSFMLIYLLFRFRKSMNFLSDSEILNPFFCNKSELILTRSHKRDILVIIIGFVDSKIRK